MEDKDQNSVNTSFYEEETKEILGNPPNWVFQYGNTVYILLLLFVVFFTWKIEYPVYLNFEAKLVFIEIPDFVQIRKDETVLKLHVKDGNEISKGQLIMETEYKDSLYKFYAKNTGHLKFLKKINEDSKSSNNDSIMFIVQNHSNNKIIVELPSEYINNIKIDQSIFFNVNQNTIKGNVTGIHLNSMNRVNKIEVEFISTNDFIPFSGLAQVRILKENRRLLYKILNVK